MAAPVPLYDRLLGAVRETDGPAYGTVGNPFISSGTYMYDTAGNLWVASLSTSGVLTWTFGEPAGGEIFGLWSFLPRTYSE